MEWARDLKWAIDRVYKCMAEAEDPEEKRRIAYATACTIADEDAAFCERIGIHGLEIINRISKEKNGRPVNILTHCNAGWLATVDWGTALAPIYVAHDHGLPVHVWVDETRPRNQGSQLTAWELARNGVPHTLIADNSGGHLMQHGQVDLVIVGTDRTTYCGDVANKIGTYLKALAARDNHIPFYVALPSSTFDWQLRDGIKEIPIEERDPDEIRYIQGRGVLHATGRYLSLLSAKRVALLIYIYAINRFHQNETPLAYLSSKFDVQYRRLDVWF